MEALVKFTVDKYGRIDCLVNNAGYHPIATPFAETTYETFTNLLTLNLTSYFYLSQYFIKYII